MMKIVRNVYLLLLLPMLLSCVSYVSYTDTAVVNGQSLFYASEGKGKPVVLIHGNGGSHNDLETTTRQLAQAGYLVYAIDSRGQGANAPLKEYHYADMAEDTYQFIQQKHIHKPAVFGWSDGGIIALQLESSHPGTCSLLITSGANITAQNAIDPKIYESIFGDGTKPLEPLVKMMRDEPNMTKADMELIQCPALICAGEHDLILESHTKLIASSIPHGQLMIVPGADHGSHIWHNRKMGDIILDFFRQHKY